jgi:prepilin peptidase CpaA
MLLSNWPVLVSVVAACIAAVTDLRTRIIPNWLTLPLPLLALFGHFIQHGASGLLISALGCLVCFLPCFFLFARGAVGGGDVKLFASFGALLGAGDGLELQLTAFVLVSAYTVWRMAWHGKLWALMSASYRASLHLAMPSRFAAPGADEGSHDVPMGLSILLATLALALREAL